MTGLLDVPYDILTVILRHVTVADIVALQEVRSSLCLISSYSFPCSLVLTLVIFCLSTPCGQK